MKRVVDVLGSLAGLMFLAMLAPITAFLILLEDKGPIFIKCRRISAGRIVSVWKFRTMRENAREIEERVRHLNERADGPFFKLAHNPAVTKVGRFLRMTRMDELPQVINVLRGELSLVGPRPHEPKEMTGYPPMYRRLALAKAGITGYSQIHGNSRLPFRRELELDAYYVEHESFMLDVRIILSTLYVILLSPNGM